MCIRDRYNADAANFPECGWIGSQAQAVPGSNTWAFKNIVGALPDKLTATQTGYAVAKNAGTYETIGGVSRTTSSKTCQNERIDTMVVVDWTESRMQEGLWFVLANSAKVPYTNQGISRVEAQVRKVLAEGIRNGAYADSPAPTITVPDASSVSSALKATRTLEGVTFTAVLAGAIEKVVIRGTVSVGGV